VFVVSACFTGSHRRFPGFLLVLENIGFLSLEIGVGVKTIVFSVL
jgi:hypothetical protein